MRFNERFGQVADDAAIQRTADALIAQGMTALIVNAGSQAKAKVLDLLPRGAEVMTMTSMTLEEIGLADEIATSGRHQVVRERLNAMDPKTQGQEMRRLGAAPEWVIGSVHAVTEDGSVLIASNSGSQLPAYAYGASKVIWVVGAQKIVKNRDEGLRRLYEYSFPLEDERARKAYGVPSGVNKILIVTREKIPGRITVVLVKEKLGF